MISTARGSGSRLRINPESTLLDALSSMSEGNPGAINVLMRVLETADKVDPDAASSGGLLELLHMDSLGLYGSRIWMLYKDVCGGSLPRFLAVLRANQLGFVAETDLNHAIDNHGDGIDPDGLWEQVCQRLPRFEKPPREGATKGEPA